ncbi:dicarboxylate/amino acid:cation symporter [Paracoccus zeaxanthinifaciens]|uniref:dicarboxylate/amino acid:cation symporter n=1 Tax=Paracoccus zeaxanthinifaciens TaxID=187400 RepID=UPI0003B4E0A1|nr:dicarboxylate/amino acid:cation symporter [Paracoccus zeaxanthinifaciens]
MNDRSDAPRGLWGRWRSMLLWKQIFLALAAGVVIGVVLNQTGNEAAAEAIKPIGTIFVNAIKMLIVPLIFVSLVVGMTSMHDMSKMGRIGLKTVALYLMTTAVAITIGLVLGAVIQPGAGIDMSAAAAMEAKDAPSLIDTIVGLVPTNPVSASAEGNVLQIIVFAILFGIAINMAGEKGRIVRDFFDSLSEVIYKLTSIIIGFAPYGVFALMVWVAGTYGLELLLPLGAVIFAVYLGCVIHALVVYGGMIRLGGGLNPVRFFQGVLEPQMVAFTSTSSSGTLPVSMTAVQRNLGASKGVSSFVLPLGATINMDGTALYQGVCALFVAQAFNVDLAMGDYVTIVLTATLASIGTAGVPGAGLIMLSLVLTSVGLPLEGVAIIAGIDRILDMARTALNVTGDAAVTVLVAKSEGELDQAAYDTPHVLDSASLKEMRG